MAKPKVLILAYLFPPIAGGGIPRPLKFCKYLPEYGWNTVVLTVDPSYHVSLDESLLEQVPAQTPVYRAKEFNPYETLNRLRTTKNGGAPPSFSSSSPSSSQRFKASLFQLIKNAKNHVLVPDDHVLWVPFAVRKGMQAIREQKIDVIYSTSGPYSSHLVGRALQKRTGLPWIADFRDPWTQNMHRSGIFWREKAEEKMEKSVMTHADVVLTVTRTFAENFKAKYPQIQRLEVIHNGYDPEDYTKIESQPVPDRFVLAYTGVFYQKRNPRLFLQAVSELVNEGVVNQRHLLIRFAGVFDYPGQSENREAVEKYGLKDVVETPGYLPHQDSLSLLKSADVLLLFGDTAPGSGAYIPGKVYEYMAVQRPILALSRKGETSSIVENLHLGKVVDPEDKEAMKTAVRSFYEDWLKGKADSEYAKNLDDERLLMYRRDQQAKELSLLCEDVREKGKSVK